MIKFFTICVQIHYCGKTLFNICYCYIQVLLNSKILAKIIATDSFLKIRFFLFKDTSIISNPLLSNISTAISYIC